MSNWSLLAPVSVAGQQDFEARDKSAGIGSQSNGAFAEIERPHAKPLNADHSRGFRKSLVVRDCVVADAVPVEPVSTSQIHCRAMPWPVMHIACA
jgi:hypothetical protein